MTFSRTRGKYVPVRSTAASLLLTVLENAMLSCNLEHPSGRLQPPPDHA